jgi:hypothetical protein
MKFIEIQLVEQTKYPAGMYKPAAAPRLLNVDGSLNQHGVVIPFVDAAGAEREHLIPWARVVGITRERTVAK